MKSYVFEKHLVFISSKEITKPLRSIFGRVVTKIISQNCVLCPIAKYLVVLNYASLDSR